MARSRLERNVLTSFLDRLIDHEPKKSGDPTLSFEESVRVFKQAVLRDLEWLLNTRRSLPHGPPLSRELENSILNYGLPDISALGVRDPEARSRLVRNVEETIARFEPRLSGVRAVLHGSDDSDQPQELHILIHATLEMDPSPERIVFDTLIDVNSGHFSVEDRQDA